MGLITLGLSLGAVVLTFVGMWAVFAKAGLPGWKSLVPIYNGVVLCRICGLSGWFVLLMLVPLVNLFAFIYLSHRLSASFGRGLGTTVGLICLTVLFLLILGFGDARYGAAPAKA
jgi:hypothetical protein